jgi:hypothetical protein
MRLFGRGGTKKPSGGAEFGGEPSLAVSHRLTLDLKRAQTFAEMLAQSRASRVIEISDLLAGMYICNWDRLSQYWEEHDRDEVERVLQTICRISPQRWHSWIELYDMHRREEGKKDWSPLRRLKKGLGKETVTDKSLRPSSALASILKQAEEIAPSRDLAGERSIPILTSECVLWCIVRNLGSEVSRKLARTGLDSDRLERDALLPRHPPRGRSTA